MALIARDARKDEGEVFYNFNKALYTELYNKYKKSRFKELADTQRFKIFDEGSKEAKEEIKKIVSWLSELNHLPDEKVLILEDTITKKPAGFIVGFTKNKGDPWNFTGRLEDLYVLPEYRKLGGGKVLVNSLLEWFRKRGCVYVSLNVDAINQNAVKFYEKFGFKKSTFVLHKKL